MNKEVVLKQLNIHDQEQIPKIKRVIDLANKTLKTHEVTMSGFLSPDLHEYIHQIMFNYPDLGYKIDGGHAEFEYGCVIIYPDYLTELPVEVVILDVSYLTQYGEIGHRDVLGSVLGLGIKRDVIGDILLEPGHVQIMVLPEISSYLEANLSKIGRVTVSSKIVQSDELIEFKSDYKEISSTVKSLRLDAIIASGYNISRGKAVDLIKAERVKVNHNYTSQASKEIGPGTLISIKGKGRMFLEEVNGLTKKERYKIKIKKFI